MIRARNNTVVLAVVESRAETASGLLLGRAVDSPIGIVMSVGKHVCACGHNLACKACGRTAGVEGLKPGDHVVWKRDLGATFEVGGIRYAIASPWEILGIVDGGRRFELVEVASDDADATLEVPGSSNSGGNRHQVAHAAALGGVT